MNLSQLTALIALVSCSVAHNVGGGHVAAAQTITIWTSCDCSTDASDSAARYEPSRPSTSSVDSITRSLSSQTTTAATADNTGGQQSLVDTVLNSTNFHRQQHVAAPLRWNESLATSADLLAHHCIPEHDSAGQNLVWQIQTTPNKDKSPPATFARDGIDIWADEQKDYDYNQAAYSDAVGHFTQLVWRSTTDVGCALYDCDGSNNVGLFLVCNYYPPGNVLNPGQFKMNVRPPVTPSYPQDRTMFDRL